MHYFRFGRRISFLISLAIMSIFSIASSFSNSYLTFTILRFLVGVGVMGCFTGPFVLGNHFHILLHCMSLLRQQSILFMYFRSSINPGIQFCNTCIYAVELSSTKVVYYFNCAHFGKPKYSASKSSLIISHRSLVKMCVSFFFT